MKILQYLSLLILLLLLSIQHLFGQLACSDPTNIIYGVDAQGGILPINVNTASVGASMTNSGYTGYPGATNSANGLALRIQTGLFYYFHHDLDGDQDFVSFDPLSHVYTVLSPLPTVRRVVKACITADGSGYYCMDGQNNLCYYDIAANHWTVIGSNLINDHGADLSSVFTDLGSGDMAIDARGRLWIIVSNAATYGIYCIQSPLPTTAQASVVMNEIIAPTRSTPTGDLFAGIAFDPAGQIHMSTENDLFLLQNDFTLIHVAALSNPGSGADLTSCNFPFQILAGCHVDLGAKPLADNAVSLRWTVEMTEGIERTELYRSRDGEHWQKLAIFHDGMSGSTGAYEYADADAGAGKVYYKVCVVDKHGKTTTSEIRTLDLKNFAHLALWPMPVQNLLNISNDPSVSAVHVGIYGNTGKILRQQALVEGTNSISLSGLDAGVYILRFTYRDGGTSVRSIVKY